MPYIMNALETKVTVQAHGKWFTWQPKEIKILHNVNLAQFISQYRGEDGLVEVPESIMEMDKTTSEYKQFVEDKRIEGVTKRIQKLDSIKRNLLSSLRYDVESKGIKADPLTFASKGELAAIKELHSLKEFEATQQVNTADEIRKLLEGTEDGSSNNTNARAVNTGSSYTTQSTKSGK